jgi:FecR protein
MKGHRLADLAARAVRRARPEAPPSLPRDRRKLVAAIEGALRVQARRRVVTRWVVGTTGVALAAAFALLLGMGSFGARGFRAGSTNAAKRSDDAARARTLTVLGEGDEAGAILAGARRVPLQRGMTLEPGIRLVAPASSEVRVGTSDGTSLTLEASTELAVSETGATQRFALARGAVRARVARLFAGERFIIQTSGAEVEVHGTVFRVAIEPVDARCGEGPRTHVSVSEGVVSVRAAGAETRVSPGENWTSACAPAARAQATGSTTAARAEARVRRRGTTAAAPALETAEAAPAVVAPPAATTVARAQAPEASKLGAQNDLFAAAARARNQGHAAEAARLFGQLAHDYPGSPLVESALVQRMKALATLDAEAGAQAAREYLARFPSGIALAEAQRLIDRPTP